MAEPKLKDKRWKKELEEPLYEDWKKREIYKFDKGVKKPVYSIDAPTSSMLPTFSEVF